VITLEKGDTVWANADATGIPWTEGLLREDLRVGAVIGPEVLSFGDLEWLAACPSGRIVAYDSHRVRVSSFSKEGVFEGFVGRSGGGPGEYKGVHGLACSQDDNLFVATNTNSINVYGGDGAYLYGWVVPARVSAEHPIQANNDWTVTVKVVLRPARATGEPAGFGFIVFSSLGEVLDHVPEVETPWDLEASPGLPELASRKTVEWSPEGYSIAGVSNRLAFQLQYPDGRMIRFERRVSPAEFLREEWEEWEAMNRFLRARSGRPERYPPPEQVKPVFKEVLPSRTGEIWVLRNTESTTRIPSRSSSPSGVPNMSHWEQPLLFDLFNSSGQFLGNVSGPTGFEPRAASGDTLWGFMAGDFGEEYIVRLVAIEDTGRDGAAKSRSLGGRGPV